MCFLRIALFTIAALPLAAQQRFIVDASGQTGRFKTISAAITAAKDGDFIYVKKGAYKEHVEILGKSVNVIGIAASAADVQIVDPGGAIWEVFRIANHPAGRTTRVSRLRIRNLRTSNSLSIFNSSGDIVLDSLDMERAFTVFKHAGIVSVTGSKATSPSIPVIVDHAAALFLHDCEFTSTGTNSRLVATVPGAQFASSTVELARCRILGSSGHAYSATRSSPGGPGVFLYHSHARITGLVTDAIRGGPGRYATPVSRGGPGVWAHSSTLVWSGAVIFGGFGGAGPGPMFEKSGGSHVTRQAPAAPVLTLSGSFARDRTTTTALHAAPSAASITFVALDFRSFPTAWGNFLIDPDKPALIRTLSHDARGIASFAMDLRGLPATFVGAPFVVQSFTLDTKSNFAASAPRFGVVGF